MANTTISPSAGSVALTGPAASFILGTGRTPTAGGLTLAGVASKSGGAILPGTGSLGLTGIASYLQSSAVGPIQLGPPGAVRAVYNITGAILIKGGPGVLVTIACTTTGNITLHDCVAAAAVNAANLIGTFVMTTGLNPLTLNWPCSNGIYVSAVSAGIFSIAYT